MKQALAPLWIMDFGLLRVTQDIGIKFDSRQELDIVNSYTNFKCITSSVLEISRGTAKI